MRYRLMATYRGVPYEAGVGPTGGDVVLFAACPPPEELGFEPATGHWRKQVIWAEVDGLWESRPVGIFRGEPCVVLDDLGERLHIAYLGTDADRAARLGYWQVDRGVFELLTPREDVSSLTEERVERPLRWAPSQSADAAAATPPPTARDAPRPTYPYGAADWPSPPPPPDFPGSPNSLAGPTTSEWRDRGTAGAAAPGTGEFPAMPAPQTGEVPAMPAPQTGEFPAMSAPLEPLPGAPLPSAQSASPRSGTATPPSGQGPAGTPSGEPWVGDPALEEGGPGLDAVGGRSARRQRVTTRDIFCELADLAAIPRSAYALEVEVDGAMCLLANPDGFEVFLAVEGARHEVRTFSDEEAAYFYLFGLLAAEAIRHGLLLPTGAATTYPGLR